MFSVKQNFFNNTQDETDQIHSTCDFLKEKFQVMIIDKLTKNALYEKLTPLYTKVKIMRIKSLDQYFQAAKFISKLLRIFFLISKIPSMP